MAWQRQDGSRGSQEGAVVTVGPVKRGAAGSLTGCDTVRREGAPDTTLREVS